MQRRYPLGDQIVLTATFVNPRNNQPVSPSTVALRVRDPNNVEQRPVVQAVGVGQFTAVLTPTLAGVWRTRWEGGAPVNAAIEHEFEVTPSGFSGA